MNIQQKVITRNNVFLFMDNYYIFPNCFDSDYPGDCLETIVFSKNEKYSLNGYTHGLISHSIKHYKEFEPLVVNEYLDKVIELIRSAPCIFLIDNKAFSKVSVIKHQFLRHSYVSRVEIKKIFIEL